MVGLVQVIGLILASASIAFVLIAKGKSRISVRAFTFWISFWMLFIAFDVYPSVATYLGSLVPLRMNEYVLYVAVILSFYILLYAIYSSQSDLGRKVAKLTRELAIIENRIRKMETSNDEAEKNRHSDPGS